MSLHRQRVHPVYDPSCFGCRISTLQFCTPPTNDAKRAAYEGQRQWAAEFHNGDREAYKRLRHTRGEDGNFLQPPRIAGSAELEKHAETAFEVATGRIAPDRKQLNEALAFAGDNGIDPLKAVTTPVED